MFHYDTDNDVLFAGINTNATEKLQLGFDIVYTNSDASLDEVGLNGESWVATHPAQIYDFSDMDTYSDLDLSRLEITASARYAFADRFWLNGYYRYADLDDDAPYLYDTTGSVDEYGLSVGRSF
ncbi:MAG: hypothetical protein HYU52_13570 [Acidobacteria bacterium]|nr:hypothetical protein [Acidobacteriota bacterium]